MILILIGFYVDYIFILNTKNQKYNIKYFGEKGIQIALSTIITRSYYMHNINLYELKIYNRLI